MTTAPVQRPLTVFVPIKEDKVDEIHQLTAHMTDIGLDAVGTVHFARIFMVPKDNKACIAPNLAAVITSYDGNFTDYIAAFVDQVADVFDLLLAAADDKEANAIAANGGVKKNGQAFAEWVQSYDLTFTKDTAEPGWGFWYSAYPTKTVKQILAPTS